MLNFSSEAGPALWPNVVGLSGTQNLASRLLIQLVVSEITANWGAVFNVGVLGSLQYIMKVSCIVCCVPYGNSKLTGYIHNAQRGGVAMIYLVCACVCVHEKLQSVQKALDSATVDNKRLAQSMERAVITNSSLHRKLEQARDQYQATITLRYTVNSLVTVCDRVGEHV